MGTAWGRTANPAISQNESCLCPSACNAQYTTTSKVTNENACTEMNPGKKPVIHRSQPEFDSPRAGPVSPRHVPGERQ